MPDFEIPNFEDGTVELRYADSEVCIYGSADGLRRLADLCSRVAIRPAPHHLHLEDYALLTSASARGVIGVFNQPDISTRANGLPAIARNWIGRRMTGAYAAVRLSDSQFERDDPDFIWLQFDDSLLVRLRLASNGWNLSADYEFPLPYDLDKYGEGVLIDFARRTVFGKYKGDTVRGVATLDSPKAGNNIGVRLFFEGGAIAIVNWGDTLKWGEGSIADFQGDPHPIVECPVK